MKYWLLTSEFPPLYGGGISTYCRETVAMLTEQGHHVTVFTQDSRIQKTSEDNTMGFRIIRFNPNQFYTSAFLGYEANLSYAFSQVLQQYIKKENCPDIIEAQEYMGIAYYLLQFKHLGYSEFKNLKVLITLHAPSFLYLEYNKVTLHRLPYFWVSEMEKFCIRSADLLISPSKYLIEEIKNRVNINDLKIHIVNNPYRISKENSKNTIQKNRFVFFGKLTPQKGCLELIHYFQKLWLKGFKHSLLMIGGGDHLYHPEGVDMIDFIKKTYPKEIKQGLLQLLGAIHPDQLSEQLRKAHIVLIPSIVDNLPYTLLETMGMGKIVLASKQGGQAEVIENNKDGFLFDHKEENSFELQLKQILQLNNQELNLISEKAHEKIKNKYSYKAVYDQKINLINELLNSKVEIKIFPFIRQIPAKQVLNINSEETCSLLSIVIPYYNMGKFVEECILSILKSKYKNIEIIIVNDGSTDKQSINVLNTLENKYPLKIIHQINRGLASTRNAGAMQAKGDFLAFLDPDDTVEPEYYSKAIEVLKKCENVYFVGCWAKYFGKSNVFWPTFNPEPPFLLVHNTINSSALVYKKQAFLKSGLNDATMIYGMEDYESVINLTKHGYQGVVLPEALWNYRVRKGSMIRMLTLNKQLYSYRLISEKHPDFYAKFASDVSNILNANGPGIKYDNPSLAYDLPRTDFIGNKLNQALIATIKSNKILRKVAIKIKRKI